jgi:hypothetical protein
VWLLGALCTALVQLRRLLRHARVVRHARPAPHELEIELQMVSSRLRMRAIPLVVSPSVPSPLVWCLGRVRMLWPQRLVGRVGENRFRAIMAHELAHVRRRDHWVAWLELVAGVVWWWNPLFWFIRRRLRDSAEMACDAVAMHAWPGERRAYAETFLELTLGSKNGAPVPVLGVSTGAHQSFERRLSMMLSERVSSKMTAAGILAIGVMGLLAVPSWSFGQSAREVERREDDERRADEEAREAEAGDEERGDAESDEARGPAARAEQERREALRRLRQRDEARSGDRLERLDRLERALESLNRRLDERGGEEPRRASAERLMEERFRRLEERLMRLQAALERRDARRSDDRPADPDAPGQPARPSRPPRPADPQRPAEPADPAVPARPAEPEEARSESREAWSKSRRELAEVDRELEALREGTEGLDDERKSVLEQIGNMMLELQQTEPALEIKAELQEALAEAHSELAERSQEFEQRLRTELESRLSEPEMQQLKKLQAELTENAQQIAHQALKQVEAATASSLAEAQRVAQQAQRQAEQAQQEALRAGKEAARQAENAATTARKLKQSTDEAGNWKFKADPAEGLLMITDGRSGRVVARLKVSGADGNRIEANGARIVITGPGGSELVLEASAGNSDSERPGKEKSADKTLDKPKEAKPDVNRAR